MRTNFIWNEALLFPLVGIGHQLHLDVVSDERAQLPVRLIVVRRAVAGIPLRLSVGDRRAKGSSHVARLELVSSSWLQPAIRQLDIQQVN